jgi:hypothetical protein
MFAGKVLLTLCFVISNLGQGAIEEPSSKKWVIIGSGEEFTFEFRQKVTVEDKSSLTEGEVVLLYKNERLVLKKVKTETGFSTHKEAQEKTDAVSEGLFESEKMAFALMQKNIEIVDDVAGVLVKPTQRESNFPIVNAVKFDQAFRYALMIEIENGVVLRYFFIRQGKLDPGCPELDR